MEDNRFVYGIVRVKLLEPSLAQVECALPKWLIAFLFLLAVLVGASLVVTVGFALWRMRDAKKQTRLTPP